MATLGGISDREGRRAVGRHPAAHSATATSHPPKNPALETGAESATLDERDGGSQRVVHAPMDQRPITSRAQVPSAREIGVFTLGDCATLAQYLGAETDPPVVVGEDHVAKALE